MKDYLLHTLPPRAFEGLVVKICHEILGFGTISFSSGPDGGRDAFFEGTAQRFPSEAEPWVGKFVIQAKHTERADASCSEAEFARIVKKEAPKVKAQGQAGRCDNYLLFTNRKLGALKEDELAGDLRKKTGVGNVAILGKEVITSYFEGLPEIAEAIGLQVSPFVAVAGLPTIPPPTRGIAGREDELKALRRQVRLFISYSHDDEVLRRELEKHLALLEREGAVRIWHDREIGVGEEWRGQIDDELEAADLILLLVSASFIASDYCWDVEATRALERHRLVEARVIPVIVRECDWQSAPFAELQALPTDAEPVTVWKNRDQAWTEVTKSLRKAIGDLCRTHRETPAEHEALEQRDRCHPRYPDDESRSLSRRLKTLFKRRKEFTLAGDDTVAVEAEILDVRRLLRKGPQLRPGEFLGDGRYELIEAVGQCGFATVWKAWDGEEERPVALKVLHGHHSQDRGKCERFFRGARTMAELAHPFVARVLDVECVDDGWYFFVMEYLSGGNFEQAVLGGVLTAERQLEILLEAGEALEYTHQNGAVHRDVKPSNILLDAGGRARLSDFDLVRAADTTGLTATQAMMGTIQFAAPEALVAAERVGPAADIYSLASTVVFALAGGRLAPWYYRDPARAITGLECGRELKRVLKRATAFVAEERYPAARVLCQELGAAASATDSDAGDLGLALAGQVGAPPVSPGPRWGRRRSWSLGAGGVAILAVALWLWFPSFEGLAPDRQLISPRTDWLQTSDVIGSGVTEAQIGPHYWVVLLDVSHSFNMRDAERSEDLAAVDYRLRNELMSVFQIALATLRVGTEIDLHFRA